MYVLTAIWNLRGGIMQLIAFLSVLCLDAGLLGLELELILLRRGGFFRLHKFEENLLSIFLTVM